MLRKSDQKYTEAHKCRIHHHVNIETIQLLDMDTVRRLITTRLYEVSVVSIIVQTSTG